MNAFTHPPEFDDIQGLVRFAYKHLTQACFLLLRVTDRNAARIWLAEVPLTNAAKLATAPETALNVAFTSAGLHALGLAPEILEEFSSEFVAGMSGDANRARRLGDVDDSDPERWEWGAPHRLPHVLVMLYAKPGKLEALQQSVQAQCEAGFEQIACLATSDMDGVEPFGFADGASQPQLDWDRLRAAHDQEQLDYLNLTCLGEFLLGYPNEYGGYTDRPLLDPIDDASFLLPRAEDAPHKADLGRNGSYLVMRQLHQDVQGFWQFLDRQAGGDAAMREQLAEAMVGRKRNGEPLVPIEDSITHDTAVSLSPTPLPQGEGLCNPRPAGEGGAKRRERANVTNFGKINSPMPGPPTDDVLNDFTYRSDPHGIRCPLGAHIRRANPRNADLPPGGPGIVSRLQRTLGFDADARSKDLVASTRFHRLLRRGREYGVPVSIEEALAGTAANTETGLHFICLGANIARQFEFVQTAWMIGGKFDALGNESDPLIGHRQPAPDGTPGDRFSIPQAHGPDRQLCGLPRFVSVRGGAYFFLPGLRALRYIAIAP